MEETDKSLSFIKTFIRYFISSIAYWRVAPNCNSSFVEKNYVGIHAKYMDAVDRNLRVRNDNIYKITQWVERGIVESLATIRSFRFLIFHHEKHILETFSCELRPGLTNKSVKKDTVSKGTNNMKSEIRKTLETALMILERSSNDYLKGKVSVNILMTHTNSIEVNRNDESIIQKSLKHPLKTVLSSIHDRNAVIELNEDIIPEDTRCSEEPLFCQFSNDFLSYSEATCERLGFIHFPCHNVEIFHHTTSVDLSNKDHLQEMKDLFQVVGPSMRSSFVQGSADQYQSDESPTQKRNKHNDALASTDRSPKMLISANTPYPSSSKKMSTKALYSDNLPDSNSSQNHTPVASPKHRMLFGDTPVLRRRNTRSKFTQVTSNTPMNRSRRTTRSGSLSEEPTVILPYSISESKMVNPSPYYSRQYFTENSTSPVPPNKFSFSPE